MTELARDIGPHPLLRAVLGLAVGLAAGALIALLVPRDRDDPAPVARARR